MSVAAVPNIPSNLTYKYYDVEGDSYRDLAKGMKDHGPGDFFAVTNWQLNWVPNAEAVPGGYKIAKAAVGLIGEITMPKWTPPATADDKLKQRWNTFITKLNAHELGHISVAQRAASQALEAIKNLQGTVFPTQQALADAAQAAIIASVKNGDKENVHYDKVTDHGATQGATF